jgi:putative integral membrane protein (TIGR02587 family)
MRESAREYGRGVAGGLIFSLPLLFTMEVWWAGFLLEPGRILAYVVVTFCLLLVYNRFAGLRRDASWVEVVIDSVEEMGLGLVLAAAMLWVTGQLDADAGIHELTGKIVMEAMTVAVGVSVGSSQLGESTGDEGVSGGGDEDGYLSQAAVALCGAVLFSANVAATEEIEVIAMATPPTRILLLAVASMAGASWLLDHARMHGSSRHVPPRESSLQRLQGAATTYAVALSAAAGALHFFGRLDGRPAGLALAMIVVAGVPAALGASAGRLLLQSRTPD